MRRKRRWMIMLVLLGIGLGVGAFFILKKGTEIKKQEEEKVILTGLEDIEIEAGEELPQSLYEVLGNEKVAKVMVDTAKVDTTTAGKYPITYVYLDTDGNEYEKTIQCVVTEKEDVPNFGTQEMEEEQTGLQEEIQEHTSVNPANSVPKTADFENLLFYSILAGVSFFTVCCGIAKKKKGVGKL